MRGKAKKIIVPLRRSRITPAYAGKSFTSVFQHVEFIGITPAYAGKS